ncbi:MAG: amino acid adenylation domain-containing protein, partial [bacterium]|nr:amino acid adenylation domain-containing protein [bacterium]
DVMFNLLTVSTGKPAENKPQSIGPTTETTDLLPNPDPHPDSEYSFIDKTSKFDLTLTCLEMEKGGGEKTGSLSGEIDRGSLEFQFEYCVKLFKKETIRRFAAYFKKVLQAVSTKPGGPIGDIEIITQKEKETILYEFNDTTADYPKKKTIHRLFVEQVERTPDHISIVGREKPVGSRQYAVGNRKEENDKLQNTNYKQITSNKKNKLQTKKKTQTKEQLQIAAPNVGGIHESRLDTQSTLSIPSTQKTPLQETQSRQVSAVTYRELNEKSNRLAGLLLEKGTKPGAIIGIMVERSIEMIIGLLGILKAGAAYLPIDPHTPKKRIEYMLKDSNAKIVLKELNELHEFDESGEGIEIIDINTIYQLSSGTKNRQQPSSRHPSGIRHPASGLAYIIYTSGTTGKPKGVMVEHRAAVNILTEMQREYPLKRDDTYLFKTSYIFDVSVAEIFGWYLDGGRLAVLEKDAEKDPRQIIETIKKHRITHINFVPSMFGIFVEALKTLPGDPRRLPALKYVFLAGEALSPVLVEKFKQIDPEGRIRLENVYGPTEGTIYASRYSLAEWGHVPGGNRETVPIGKPIGNVNLYIFDKYDNLLPVGVPGELIISGTGLARGYLNKPGLTAERFANYKLQTTQATNYNQTIKDKLQKAKKEKIADTLSPSFPNTQSPITNNYLYHTGDLCRWMPDGNIEFLGRIDQQVKIRGFRIELGEVENRLLMHPGLKEAVVLVKGTGGDEQYLFACIVPCGDGVEMAQLREYLLETLPEYMIPGRFVTLEQIPTTTSGKVDRRA